MSKELKEYLNKDYQMEIIKDQDEGGYVVYYPDLPGYITCAETIEEALKNAVDAKKAWLEAAIEDGIKIKRWAIIKPIFDITGVSPALIYGPRSYDQPIYELIVASLKHYSTFL